MKVNIIKSLRYITLIVFSFTVLLIASEALLASITVNVHDVSLPGLLWNYYNRVNEVETIVCTDENGNLYTITGTAVHCYWPGAELCQPTYLECP